MESRHCAESHRWFSRYFITRALDQSLSAHLSIDTANRRRQSMSRSIKTRSPLSLSFSVVSWSWTIRGSCVSSFSSFSCHGANHRVHYRQRSIDRSITIDTVLRSRSRRTTISPWAASLRDCGHYFVSTRCERWMRARARACIYNTYCLTNWPEFCLANWPQLSLPSLGLRGALYR